MIWIQKLSGIFEVKIYPQEYNIPQILSRAKDSQRGDLDRSHTHAVAGVDLDALDATLSHIDRVEIKRRKNLYNRLYHEARISGKEISFTNMLFLLAHHKLIVDREALM